MILLCGLPNERPLEAIYQALERLGCPVFLFDQRQVLETELELTVGSDVRGTLRVRDRSVDLSAVTAVYLRNYDSRQVPSVVRAGEGSREWQHALNIDDCLLSWAEVTPAVVVNRPSAMASNGSKPYQAELIRRVGFEIPETLITTDPEAVREFHARYGEVIYKSVSGVRSIVSRLTPESLTRLDDVTWCPTQFQQCVSGTDYRVHIAGEELFACEIQCEADDYRYAVSRGIELDIRGCDLPADCADRCRALASSLELSLAGIDLRCTADGRWYCFEVNPSPAFTYYQAWSGQPIDDAVARLLAGRSNVSMGSPRCSVNCNDAGIPEVV